MTYKDALDFIRISYDKEFNLQLDRISKLMELLGNPQDELKIIHVAGTNGKGSVCAMTAEILKAAGYKVGMFTSPVIIDYREQFQINGELISEDNFVAMAEEVKKACEKMLSSGATNYVDPIYRPSEFEKSVALAFLYFKSCACDFVILEVGMGGDYDATNVISKSEVSVIVNIDYDHMHFLGNTLEEIADKKAGIIKENGCVVVADQKTKVLDVIKKRASEKNATYHQTDRKLIETDCRQNKVDTSQKYQFFSYKKYSDIRLSLLGNHQRENAAIVLEVISCLKENGYCIPTEAVYSGLSNTSWPGRFEIVSTNPLIIIDGAHNPDGIEALYDNLTTYFPEEKFVFITGILRDKDYSQMLKKMIPLAKAFIAIEPKNPRAMSSSECKNAILEAGFDGNVVDIEEDKDILNTAIELSAEDGKVHPICAFGSLYSVGRLKKLLENK